VCSLPHGHRADNRVEAASENVQLWQRNHLKQCHDQADWNNKAWLFCGNTIRAVCVPSRTHCDTARPIPQLLPLCWTGGTKPCSTPSMKVGRCFISPRVAAMSMWPG